MDIDIFGLSTRDFVAIIVTFYIGHTRSKKSEQIRVSREIWDRIDAQEEIFEKMTMEDMSSSIDNRMKLIKAIDSLTNELDYFVYLVEKDDIKNSIVREYYRKRLVPIFRTAKFIDEKYPDTGDYSRTKEILDRIAKYHKITHKMKEYKEEFISTQNVKL
jgi:hypothetical protein